MSFVRKFSLTLLTNIVIVLLGVLNNVVVVRTTGANGIGLFTLVITSATTIMILLSGGALAEANRYLSKKYKEELIFLFSNSLLFSFGITVLLFLWWILLRGYPFEYFLNKDMVFIVLLATLFLLIQESNKGILWGLERIDKHNLINILRSAFLLISNITLLIFLNKNIEVAIIGWLITLILGAVVSIWYVMSELKCFKLILNKNTFLKSLSIGWRTFIISALFIISLRVDIYIIKLFLDNSAVGYYSVVVLIATMVNISPMISGMLIFNRAVTQESKGLFETAQLSRFCMAYSLLISIALIFLGKYLFTLLFGPEFIKSYYCLLYFLPALIAQNLISVIALFICGGEGFPIFIILSLLASSIINVILNIILVPQLGINGAAISASIAIGTRAIMSIFYFRLRTNLRFTEFLVLKKSDILDLKNRLGLKLA